MIPKAGDSVSRCSSQLAQQLSDVRRSKHCLILTTDYHAGMLENVGASHGDEPGLKSPGSEQVSPVP